MSRQTTLIWMRNILGVIAIIIIGSFTAWYARQYSIGVGRDFYLRLALAVGSLLTFALIAHLQIKKGR